MKAIAIPIVLSAFVLCIGCQEQKAPLTDAASREIVDSATYILQRLFDAQNKDFKFDSATIALFKHYHSNDPDIRHIAHGVLYTSVDSMFKQTESSRRFRETVEFFESRPDRYDAVVLSRDAVSITIPSHWKMKVRGRPEYAGTEVLSFLLQKRKGRWMIIQSHVSDPRICEAMAALMPGESDEEK